MNVTANESVSDEQSETQTNGTLGNIVIINCVINAPLMLISILGNFLVFTAIWRTVSLRSRPSMVFISSLAVTDLLVGFIVQPMYIANLLTSVRLLKFLSSMLAFAACLVSLSTMATISFDRFLALHYHMRYAAIMTSPRVISALVATWVTIGLLSCLVFWDPETCMVIIAILISFYLIISAYFYVRIYRIVRRHQIQIHHQDCNPHVSIAQALNQNRLNKSSLNTFVFYISTILCYLPRFISVPFSDPYTHEKTAWIFADTLVFMSSTINPVLYCWRLGDLRAAVVKVLREMLCKQTEEN